MCHGAAPLRQEWRFPFRFPSTRPDPYDTTSSRRRCGFHPLRGCGDPFDCACTVRFGLLVFAAGQPDSQWRTDEPVGHDGSSPFTAIRNQGESDQPPQRPDRYRADQRPRPLHQGSDHRRFKGSGARTGFRSSRSHPNLPQAALTSAPIKAEPTAQPFPSRPSRRGMSCRVPDRQRGPRCPFLARQMSPRSGQGQPLRTPGRKPGWPACRSN